MKKILITSLFFISSIFANNTIIIGTTPTPYGEIIRFTEPLFAEKGYKVIHKEFSDYITPNLALAEKELDANLYQHQPFLDDFNQNRKTNIAGLEPIVLVPMAVYSNKFKSLDNIKKGALIAIPNDPTNESRALELLEKAGIISFKNVSLKTPLDIKSNPNKLRFKEVKAAQTPRALDDVDYALIPTNYALGAGLNPLKDGLFIEDNTSRFAIIIAVREEDKNSKKTKIIQEVLKDPRVAKYINDTFKGSVIPTF